MSVDWHGLMFELEQLGPDAGLPEPALRTRQPVFWLEFWSVNDVALPPDVWLVVLLTWVEQHADRW